MTNNNPSPGVNDYQFKDKPQAINTNSESTPESLELREQVAKCLYECDYSKGYWDTGMHEGEKWKWRFEADEVMKLIQPLLVDKDIIIAQAKAREDAYMEGIRQYIKIVKLLEKEIWELKR